MATGLIAIRYSLSGAEPATKQAAKPDGRDGGGWDPRRSRARDLLALPSRVRTPAASAEGPAENHSTPAGSEVRPATVSLQVGARPDAAPISTSDVPRMQLLLTDAHDEYYWRPPWQAAGEVLMAY